MDYFRSRLGAHQTLEWLRREKEGGRKVIGLMSWGVPAEIVLASGGVPVRLSVIGEDAGKRPRKLPRDVCPLAASCFSEAEALVREGLLAAVVLPGTCDWKRKLPDMLSASKILTLESPSSGSLTFIDADLKRFAREVSLITDLPVVTKNLRRASEKMARAREAYKALQLLRQRRKYALSGVDALVVEQTFLRDDLSRWTEHCSRLVRALEEKLSSRDDKPAGRLRPRILLIGSPVTWKQGNPVHLIEEAGGNVVCEDFHSHLSLLYPVEAFPPRETRGAGDASLASRWTRASFYSLTAEADESFLFHAIDDFGGDGVIGHVYRTCARVQMSLPGVLRRTRDRGIPSLILETQGDPNEADRLRARIEPFVEMLLSRRRNGA